MRITAYAGPGKTTPVNQDEYNLLLPPRFIRKYKRLIVGAGFKVLRVVKNPHPGVTLDYTIRGHQMIVIHTDNIDHYVKLQMLLARWERMLKNEN